MRSIRIAIVLGALLLAGAPGTPAVADTTPPATLHVDAGSATCSDSGPGTTDEPFCHIQPAADVALPGQTVSIGYSKPAVHYYDEQVHVTRSGTPGRPVVFRAYDPPEVYVGRGAVDPALDHAFTLDGVHDVTFEGVDIAQTTLAGIDIANSTDITVDRVDDTTNSPAGDGIDVTGASSAITISRSQVHTPLTGISIGPGVTGTTVTENMFYDATLAATASAVSVTGATGTALNGNTENLGSFCPSDVFAVTGGATGTTIENNAITAGCTTATPLITVAADSTTGTGEDYDNVSATGDPAPYSWAGTGYGSAAALQAGTGQGAHDRADAQAIDDGDAGAPGVLDTDYSGRPREDDPAVADTGTGYGYLDRGATEAQDGLSVTLSSIDPQIHVGHTFDLTLGATPDWGPITGYTVNYGDGTPVVTSTTPSFSHIYTRAGSYPLVATVTDSAGYTAGTDQLQLTVTILPAQCQHRGTIGRPTTSTPSPGQYTPITGTGLCPPN